MTDQTAAGTVRIGRAGMTFSGGVDPAVARAAAERALTSLAGAGLPGRGHLANLRVEVRVPHGGEQAGEQAGEQGLAEAIAAAVAAAVRREAGR